MNSYCWNGKDDTGLNDYCKTATTASGAGGWYSYTSGTTHYCCTANKTNGSTGSAKNNGTNYTITYQGHANGVDTTKECCVNATSSPNTYANGKCWSGTTPDGGMSTYCTTSTNSGGQGGYYEYASGSTHLCCKKDASDSSITTYSGSNSYTLYIRNQNYSKTCCHNLNGTNYWYNASNETGGSCCSGESTSACCTSSQNSHSAGKWRSNTCCHSSTSSDNCCKAYNNDSAYLVGSTCCTGEGSSTCCTASNNPNGAGKWRSNTCCHSSTSSDNCCKAYNNDSAYLVGSTCCTGEGSSTCCTASNNPNGAGKWRSNTCCHSSTSSDNCCKAYSGESATLRNGTCCTNENSQACCTGTWRNNTCCKDENSSTCCTGTWRNNTCCHNENSQACCTRTWNGSSCVDNTPEERDCSYNATLQTSCLASSAKNVKINIFGKCELSPYINPTCSEVSAGNGIFWTTKTDFSSSDCGIMSWTGCTNCVVYTQNVAGNLGGSDPITLSECNGKQCKVCASGWGAKHNPCNGSSGVIVLGVKDCSMLGQTYQSDGSCKDTTPETNEFQATIVTIKKDDGIKSTTPNADTSVTLTYGGTQSISALPLIAKKYSFDSWSKSGSGCEITNSTSQKTTITANCSANTTCKCTVTANSTGTNMCPASKCYVNSSGQCLYISNNRPCAYAYE